MKNVMILIAILLSQPSFASDAQDNLSAVYKTLEVVNQMDLSCNTTSDCDLLAVGARACGGPGGFMVVTKNNADLNVLERLAHLTTSMQNEINEKEQIVSICSLAPRPAYSCVVNTCIRD